MSDGSLLTCSSFEPWFTLFPLHAAGTARRADDAPYLEHRRLFIYDQSPWMVHRDFQKAVTQLSHIQVYEACTRSSAQHASNCGLRVSSRGSTLLRLSVEPHMSLPIDAVIKVERA